MPEVNINKLTRGLKELFATFLEDPTRSGLREILQNHLGETKYLDFKEAWPSPTKTAKHILGLANSQGGGLIIGISQKADNSFEIIGLEKFEDKADVIKSVQKYLPPKIIFEVLDFYYEDSDYPKLKGKRFQILLVQDTPKYVPFVSAAEGEGVYKNAIYIRKQAETAIANYDELQEVINRRIETQFSSRNEKQLEKNLRELKNLYDCIPYYIDFDEDEYAQDLNLMRNPHYPKESYNAFIRALIKQKKQQIIGILSHNS